MRDLLSQSINELPQNYREPMVMHFIEGMKFKDIAAVLERKEETVKKQSQRALRMMRTKLQQRGVPITAVLLVSVLQQLFADEQWAYAEQASPQILSPVAAVRPVTVTAALVMLGVLIYVLMPTSQNITDISVTSVEQPVAVKTNEAPAATMQVIEKPKWKKASFKNVGTCPFGKLNEYTPDKTEAQTELSVHEEPILDKKYWRFSPKGKNPTMFETAQLRLPDEYHMKFDFKIDALKKKRVAAPQVYLGFTFNRTGKRLPLKGIQKPIKKIAERVHAQAGTWHTVDIEVRLVDPGSQSNLKDVMYSVDGELYWHVQTALPVKDIIPIGVHNTAVLMRDIVYVDIASVN